MKPGSRIGLVRSDLSGAGGAERYSLAVLERLCALGCATHVFTARLPANFESAQAHLFRPGKRKLPRMLRHRAFEAWLRQAVPAQNLDFLLSLERILPNDIYRAGGGVHRAWRDLCLRELRGARKFALQFSPAHAQMLSAERAVFDVNQTRLVICNSQMVADEVVQFYEFPRERIRVVPNGVDGDNFYPATLEERRSLRAARGLGDDDCVALFAGSGFWRKGVDRALHIVARCRALSSRNVKLVVVGRAENSSFENLARELGLNQGVLFAGAQPPNAMREWYQIADVFLFPTRYDPFANACLEAASCGVPVATTKQNGFADHISGTTGLVFDPENVDEAGCVLEEFCRDLPSPEAVRASVAHLSLEKHIENLLGVFDDAAQFPIPVGLRSAR